MSSSSEQASSSRVETQNATATPREVDHDEILPHNTDSFELPLSAEDRKSFHKQGHDTPQLLETTFSLA
jgi:hypothetical protein